MPNSWYISTTGSDTNPGTPAAPLATLQQAMINASNGDTIYFMNGTYTYTTTIIINKELTITSQNGKANATLSKTTGGIFLSIQSNNVTITDITIQLSTTNTTNTVEALISIGRKSDGTSLPTLYSNINIKNNNLKMYKNGISVNGGNITITGNIFSRNGGTEILSLFLVNYIRDTITISNNTHTDTLRTARFVWLTAAGTLSTDYYDRVNSKGGTLLINNNTIDTSANATQRPVMFIQDYYNTYNYGPVGSDTNYNSNTKLDIIMNGNNMVGNSSITCDFFAQYLTSTTCLNSYSKVTLKNNTVSNSYVGILKLDAASSLTIDSSIIALTYVYYIYSNTITNFTLRPDYVGNKTVSQAAVKISPANIYLLENTSFISTVPKLDQIITFNALPSQTYSLNSIINLSATSTSGLPVSYSSSNTTVVQVSGSTLIIKGAGSSTITASQAGNTNYNPATNVTQPQVINKANQTIKFDSSSYTFLDPVYTLNATASSGLTITYVSSDLTIATISGNQLSFSQNGQVYVIASQQGDPNYNPATSVQIEFVRNSMNNTNYTVPIVVTSAANNIITNLGGTLNITVNNINFTKTTGIAYGINTGFVGTIAFINIVALDSSGNPITNFSTENLILNLNFPQANPSSTLLMYKLITGTNTKMDPQPSGYPITLQYQSDYLWTAALPSLSEYLIQDVDAPSGGGGGDPHLKTIHGDRVLLPNDWRYVKLYQKNNIKVNAVCELLDKSLAKKLHRLDENNAIVKLNYIINNYVRKITYFTELYIYDNEELVFKYDLLNGKELINKNIILEENKCKKGLYSLTHQLLYCDKNLLSVFVHLNNNNILTIDIDNFWDDINYISLMLYDTNVEGYSGEFFNHSNENKLG